MKTISLALTLACSLLCAQLACTATFDFVNHKDRSGGLERGFLQQLVKSFGATIFIGTGTNNDSTAQAARVFKQVHAIKRQPELAKNFAHHFAHQANVTIYQGSSYEALTKILPTLKGQGKIFFFLNDHFQAKTAAQIQQIPTAVEGITEIRREIAAIKQSGAQECVIMIGNVHNFGARANAKEYQGYWAYPCLQDVCKTLLEINKNFEFALVGDMLLAFDKATPNVPLSATVKACTVSRLFDGFEYSEDELLQAEKTIATCQGTERAFLKQLCQATIGYAYPEFHALLWSGLMALDEKRYSDALQVFDQVLARPYDHWRIKHYRMLTKKAGVLRLITRQEFLTTLQ